MKINNIVNEGVNNVGANIKALYQKIYNAGDDEIEYFYHESPVFAQYWDEYEGDLDSIIAEVDPSELQVMLDELESYVDQANLAEGDVAKLAGITALGIGAGLGANYLDQQAPKVEFDGKNGTVRAYLEPAWTNRIPDNAMTIKGKDGKIYHVWSTAGKGANSKSYHAAPVEPVKEGYDDEEHKSQGEEHNVRRIDMTGKPCDWCHKGDYEETGFNDDMDGVLHCTNCGKQTDRWKMYRAKGVAEAGEWTKLPNGNWRNMHTGVQQSTPPKTKRVRTPKGNYSDEANPIKDDGNEGRPGKQNYPGMKEARVGNRMSDMQVGSPKIVHYKGKAVGEVGIDHEPSPGNGPYYWKHYLTGKYQVGYDTKQEALGELKYIVQQMDESVFEAAEDRKRNALWAQITSYEKRAKETKNDIKRDHLMKMASQLRAKLPTTDEEKLSESLVALEETVIKLLQQ